MKYSYTVIITKEEKWFVARCAELGVVSQGKTQKEAEKNLGEALELYLEDNLEAQKAISIAKPVIKTAELIYA